MMCCFGTCWWFENLQLSYARGSESLIVRIRKFNEMDYDLKNKRKQRMLKRTYSQNE